MKKSGRSKGPCSTAYLVVLAMLFSVLSQPSRAQKVVSDADVKAPEPAVSAMLKLFDTFEVVGMPAAHGEKDLDDFILSLIRNPRFSAAVNDIVVECGNIRYQAVLDRFIAGEQVPFAEVQHVWRDTTQPMCGESGFYEQLYPLVRALNQRLPPAKRMRIVAADPPIDWSKVVSYQDTKPFSDRDGSIASVMETEVLSKHRKALMLFGVFHLLHGSGPGEGNAVTLFERHYPGRTFVISTLGYYGTVGEPLPADPAALEASPRLLKAKGSTLGALNLGSFLPTLSMLDQDCNVVDLATRQASTLLDAFLFLGPQDFQLSEPLPADIALDRDYRSEWLRRLNVYEMPEQSTLEEADAGILASAADPILAHPHSPPMSEEMKSKWKEGCLSRKRAAGNLAK